MSSSTLQLMQSETNKLLIKPKYTYLPEQFMKCLLCIRHFLSRRVMVAGSILMK